MHDSGLKLHKRGRARNLSIFVLASFAVSGLAAADAKPKRSLTSMSVAERRTALQKGFVRLDKNRSGFVEIAEAPPTMVRDRPNAPLRTVRSGALWINRYDINTDGKVSSNEYVRRVEEFLGRMRPDGKVCLGDNCTRPK
jgi:hypothetical protein